MASLLFSAYDKECLLKAKLFIEKDISRHYSIEEIAAEAGINATKLKKGFRTFYGEGAFAFLRKQRMITAASLLRTSYKTIKQIAAVTGFRHTSNFNTAFTKYYNISPARYRLIEQQK